MWRADVAVEQPLSDSVKIADDVTGKTDADERQTLQSQLLYRRRINVPLMHSFVQYRNQQGTDLSACRQKEKTGTPGEIRVEPGSISVSDNEMSVK